MGLDALLVGIGREVHTVTREVALHDAVRLMAEKQTDALIVVEGGEPVGIFTTSDLVRAHGMYGGRGFSGMRIDHVMTPKLIVADSGDEIGVSVDRMLQAQIGYLPVVKDGSIVGAFLLRDLLKHQVESLSAELSILQEYLSDLQNAMAD